MPLLETLTLTLSTALAKSVLKVWLRDWPIVEGVADASVEVVGKQVQDFNTRMAAQNLLSNLPYQMALRLAVIVEREFPDLPEHDREAAIADVAAVFEGFDIAVEIARADLDGARLESAVRPRARERFESLGGDAKCVADLLLRESCFFLVAAARKLPDLQMAVSKELLTRMRSTMDELSDVLDRLVRQAASARTEGLDRSAAEFEIRYRRVVAERLNRLRLFGIQLTGAGVREYPLSIAYVRLSSTQRDSDDPCNLEARLAKGTRFVVGGEAGSGKTTLLQWLAVRAANKELPGELVAWNDRLPFYVRLRDYVDRKLPVPRDLVETVAGNHADDMPAGWCTRALTSGALVLLDGVDELPQARRQEFIQWLQELGEDFPASIVVVSSRPAALGALAEPGSLSHRLDVLGYQAAMLAPMSQHDIESFITQWHVAVADGLASPSDRLKIERYEAHVRRHVRDRPAIQKLASNPLLCAMICALNWDRDQVIPNDRMSLYEAAIEMLLATRDQQRGIVAARLEGLSQRTKRSLLEDIAYWMIRNGYSEASRREVSVQVGNSLQRHPTTPQDADQVLQELLERSGVLREPQHGVVDFVHRTFLEYLAARAAIHAGDLGVLVRHASDDVWRETIVFAAGHAKGEVRDRLVKDLMRAGPLGLFKPSFEEQVTAACCLETVAEELDPELLQNLVKRTQSLFPPGDFDAARRLAPAAALNPELLLGRENENERVVAACIRCAATVGGDAMFRVVASYASVESPLVFSELLRAWTVFEERRFLEEVIQRMRMLDRLHLPSTLQAGELICCLQLLAWRDEFNGLVDRLATMLRDFADKGHLTIGLEGIGQPALHGARRVSFDQASGARIVLVGDIERLGHLKHLTSLELGPMSARAFDELQRLKALRRLSLTLGTRSSMQGVGRLSSLEHLSLCGDPRMLGAHDELDLRPLASLHQLRSLELKHLHDIRGDRMIRMPAAMPKLEQLDVVYAPTIPILQSDVARAVSRLSIHISQMVDPILDLSRHSARMLSIISHSSLALRLPATARAVRLCMEPSLHLSLSSDSSSLEQLVLERTSFPEGIEKLIRAGASPMVIQAVGCSEETARRLSDLHSRHGDVVQLYLEEVGTTSTATLAAERA